MSPIVSIHMFPRGYTKHYFAGAEKECAAQHIQHLQYLPFGENYVSEHTASPYTERFTFTGKERDLETGYTYHGARYYDAALLTSWMAVDPMSDKYPSVSPYNYCMWNPMKLVDLDGRDTIKINVDNGTISLTKADGDHSIQYYQDDRLFKSEKVERSKCDFMVKSTDCTYKDDDNDEQVANTYYLYCTDIGIGERIFNTITKSGSVVEWDYYPSALGICAELSSSGLCNKMLHNVPHTAVHWLSWKHYHPHNSSESYYPSHSDQDHARDQMGGRPCEIFFDGKSMNFSSCLPGRGHITLKKFSSLWNQYAR